MKKLLIYSLGLIISLPVIGQEILNASFEDTAAQKATNPNNWSTCTSNNTPDIMPGVWNVNLPPSHGNSYINLVVKEDGMLENIDGLVHPFLDKNTCYKFSVDVAASDEFIFNSFGEWFNFTKPANLVVTMPEFSCWGNIEDTLFNITNVETNNIWNTFSTIKYIEQDSISKIKLKAYVSDPSNLYYGHILIDNLKLQKSGDTIKTQNISSSLNYGDEIVLSIPEEKGYSYEWLNGKVSCKDCSETTLTVLNTEEIIAKKESIEDCFIEYHKFNITIEPVIPNIITTNDDQVNDAFIITGLPNKTKVTIFNRWEQIVFSTEDYQNNWSPNHLSDGTYFYIIEYNLLDEKYTKKGTLSILR